MKPILRRALLAAALVFITPIVAHAQQIEPLSRRFAKTEAMIAMRDGIKLNTIVYAPKNIKAPLPFIFLRTPYGIESRGPSTLLGYLKDLADEGYIFVF